MRTQDAIRLLSKDLHPSARRGVYGVLAAAIAGTTALLALSYIIFPPRVDLAPRLDSLRFAGETALCLVAFLAGSAVAFLSALPARLRPGHQAAAAGIFLVLLVVLLMKTASIPLGAELLGEMDWYRGRCGPLIFILGILEGTLFVVLARAGAPTRPFLTGAWIAAAGGALGLLVMQFVCPYENVLHILIWHAAPLFLLAGLGFGAGRRLLRW